MSLLSKGTESTKSVSMCNRLADADTYGDGRRAFALSCMLGCRQTSGHSLHVKNVF